MSAHRVQAPWFSEVRAASLSCLSSPSFGAWVGTAARIGSPTADEVLQRLSDDLGEVVPFAFDGPRHRVVGLDLARRRNYAACVDAAAILAAAAIMLRVAGVRGEPRAWFVLEAPAAMPDYAHLRLLLRRPRGIPLVLDPYGLRAAPRRPSADFVVSVDDVMRSGGAVVLQPVHASLHAWASSLVEVRA